MAAIPALSQAHRPATAPCVPGFGSPYQRLHPAGSRLPVKRRARLQDLRPRGGRPGPKTSATEDVEPTVGTKVLKRLPGTQKISRGPDSNVIFVAGATGRVGSRVARELLKLGYRVRAGVRNVGKAQGLLELADELKAESPKKSSPNFFTGFLANKLFGFLTPRQDVDKPIELVKCDLENREGIRAALGNAGVVVCSIGASEKEVLDVTGPYRIDYQATKNLIEAAAEAKVNHFILVTSLGTTKIGWPASVLNLFWGVLIWKAQAEKLLENSGVPFTIIRPGGMERPTDAYKETHNLVLAKADTYTGNQVSNLQVAELIACAVSNFELAENKIVEAIAETSAPLRPIEDMLAEIPAKVVPTRRLVAKEAPETEDGEDDEAEALERKKLIERYKYELVLAKEEEKKARIDAEAALLEKAAIEKKAAELRIKAEAASLVARQAKALEGALAVAAREGRLLTDQEKQSLVASIESESKKESGDVKPASPDAQKVKVTQDISEQEKPSTKKRSGWLWGSELEVEPAAAAIPLEKKTEAEELPSEATEAAPEVVVEEVTAQEGTTQTPSVLEQDPPKTSAELVAEPRESQEEIPSTKKRFVWPWDLPWDFGPEVEPAAAVTDAITLEKKTEAEELPSEAIAAPGAVVEEVAAQERTSQASSVLELDPPKISAELVAEPRESIEESQVEATGEAVKDAPPVEKIEDEQVEEPAGETWAIKEEVTPKPAVPLVFTWPWQKSSPDPTWEPELPAGVVTDAITLEKKTEAEELPSEAIAAPGAVAEEAAAQEGTTQTSSVLEPDPPKSSAELVAEPRESQEESQVEATGEAAKEAPPVEKIEDEQVEEPAGETSAIKEEVTSRPAVPLVFRWPWQKSSPDPTWEPELPAGVVTDLEEGEEPDGDSTASPPSRPQSPYARYPDLKPPTSPSAGKPADSGREISNGPLLESPAPAPPPPAAPPRRPQSPYTMYADLRPPASPSPSPRRG